MSELTQAALRDVLRYDPDTGEFFALVGLGRRASVGQVAGSGTRADGRRRIGVQGRKYLGSRLAWLYMTGSWPSGVIDHRDGDPTNDRWANLREVTRAQNMQNHRSTPEEK